VQHIKTILRAVKLDKRGVTALEYAMIAALIAVASVTAISALGTKLSTTLSSISSAM